MSAGSELPAWRRYGRRSLDVAFVALVLLAPLKFGSLLGHSGAPFFPMSPAEWFFGYWPASIWSAVPGLLLLAVLVIDGRPSTAWLRRHWVLLAPALGLFAAACLGAVHTTERDFAHQIVHYVAGVACFMAALMLHLRVSPQRRRLLLTVVVAVGLYLGARGWYEALIGRQHQKEDYLTLMEQQGQEPDSRMLNVLDQRRILGTFGNPSLFGGYMILVLPLALALLWQWGGAVEPPGPSRAVLTALGGLAMGGALLMTGSRAPPLALGAAVVGVTLLMGFAAGKPLISRRLLLVGLAGMLAAMVLGLVIIQKRRDVTQSATVRQRLYYWEASGAMWRDAPIFGYGVGEWYPEYLRRKPVDAEETRMPHNYVFFWLTQTGLVGLLLALPFFVQPLLWWYWWRRGRLKPVGGRVAIAALVGVSAWLIQSLADFIMVSPALVMLVAALPVLVLDLGDAGAPAAAKVWRPVAVALALVAIVACLSLGRFRGERDYQAFYDRIHKEPTDSRYLRDEVERLGRLLPRSPYPWLEWGRLALADMQPAVAEFALRKAVERAPHRAAFHGYLGQALLMQGELDKALDQANLAVEWYPTEPRYRDLKASIEAALEARSKSQ